MEREDQLRMEALRLALQYVELGGRLLGTPNGTISAERIVTDATTFYKYLKG